MINLNLKGREPEGVVDTADRARISTRIMEKAMNMKDPKRGVGVIGSVLAGDRIYIGPSRNIPDIVLVNNPGYSLVGGYNLSKEVFVQEETRIGDHERQGILIAYGRGVRKANELRNAKVEDIAPTILYTLMIQPDPHMDGNILLGVFDQDFTKSRSTVFRTENECGPFQDDAIRERMSIRKQANMLTRKGKL
jgi:predicted AlkP superfamily phosphohydrolase/phosphomutase